MSRKITLDTKKEPKLPNARATGFAKGKATPGDFLIYETGPGSLRLGRFIGVIKECEKDGLEDCRGWLVVAQIGSTNAFCHENWIKAESVVECQPIEQIRKFMTMFLALDADGLFKKVREA